MVAIDNHEEDVAAALLAAHAMVNCKTSDGFTPLMLAVQNGLLGTVTKLLAGGAHPNACVEDGLTALDFACACPNGSAAIVKALLSAGARVNGNARDNGSPLMYAADAGHADMVKLLIAHGANVAMVTNRGMTALHWADGEGYSKSIGVMLKRAGEEF
jgi:ankyrin repeat protein